MKNNDKSFEEIEKVEGFTFIDMPVNSTNLVDTELKIIDVNNKDCLLKRVYTKNNIQHYIKIGGKLGGVYDPWSNFTSSTTLKRMACTFRKVSKETYEEYSKYLKTRNPVYLTQTERLIRNG